MNDRYYYDQYGKLWKEMDGLFGRVQIIMPKGSTIPGGLRANCSCCGMSVVEGVADLTNPSRRRR